MVSKRSHRTHRPRGVVLVLLPACAGLAVFGAACTVQVGSPVRRARDERVAVVPVADAHRAAIVATPSASEEPEVTVVPRAGSTIVGARSTVIVNASVERVRAVLFDFERYPEFMSNYRACKVLGTTAQGGREVRMEIEGMGGLVKLWTRVEISPPVIASGVESYDGRLLDGNVRAFQSRWELRVIDRSTTRLTVDSFMDPKLPFPDSMINAGSVAGAKAAIVALKQRAESADAP